jgi:hypothetical protein
VLLGAVLPSALIIHQGQRLMIVFCQPWLKKELESAVEDRTAKQKRQRGRLGSHTQVENADALLAAACESQPSFGLLRPLLSLLKRRTKTQQ